MQLCVLVAGHRATWQGNPVGSVCKTSFFPSNSFYVSFPQRTSTRQLQRPAALKFFLPIERIFPPVFISEARPNTKSHVPYNRVRLLWSVARATTYCTWKKKNVVWWKRPKKNLVPPEKKPPKVFWLALSFRESICTLSLYTSYSTSTMARNFWEEGLYIYYRRRSSPLSSAFIAFIETLSA